MHIANMYICSHNVGYSCSSTDQRDWDADIGQPAAEHRF